jgi:hypothetical protein
VPPRAVSVGTKFLRTGIRYDELSEEEKDQWDALDWGDGGPPTEVSSEELNRFLFNEDTVDKVFGTLMSEGYRVAGEDRIGKTIIFGQVAGMNLDNVLARPHRRAVERFGVRDAWEALSSEDLVDCGAPGRRRTSIAWPLRTVAWVFSSDHSSASTEWLPLKPSRPSSTRPASPSSRSASPSSSSTSSPRMG